MQYLLEVLQQFHPPKMTKQHKIRFTNGKKSFQMNNSVPEEGYTIEYLLKDNSLFKKILLN